LPETARAIPSKIKRFLRAFAKEDMDGRDKPTAVRLGIELSMRKYLRDTVFCWFGLS
jgi:hypothetical protein